MSKARYFLKIVKLFNLIYAKLFVILPLAIVHTMGNLFTNTSLGKVAVSFTHTIKAMEPFFLVLLSALFLREGVPRPSVTSCNKPRCVYLYYSSWFIRAVESRKGDGQTTACEVLLFHHENMGIPWEIAKLGVKQGMWGCIKKIEPGLRAYQIARSEGQPLSKYASMARINTKVHTDYLRSLEGSNDEASKEIVEADTTKKPMGNNLSKFLLVGGAVAVACTIDHGLLTKAVTFGIARRFGKLGGIL